MKLHPPSSSSLHRYITEAFDIRQAGDYGPVGSVGKEKTREDVPLTKTHIKIYRIEETEALFVLFYLFSSYIFP